jgi:hypothetical protein
MPKHNHSTTTLEPISLTIPKAAELSGLSERQVYRQLDAGAFTARRCGGRTLIDYPSWKAYHENLPPYVSGIAIPNAPHQRRKPNKSSKRGVR